MSALPSGCHHNLPQLLARRPYGRALLPYRLPLFVGVAVFIIAVATTSIAARYVSMMLMVPGVYTGYVVALGWISNPLPRPPAKRAAALALINAVSNASQI